MRTLATVLFAVSFSVAALAEPTKKIEPAKAELAKAAPKMDDCDA